MPTKKRHDPLLNWEKRPLHRIGTAAMIVDRSPSGIYEMARRGELDLVTVDGQPFVTTASLLRRLKRVKPWTPSRRNTAAVAGRQRQRTRQRQLEDASLG